MGLYGYDKCIYNEHVSNPFYLTRCKHPDVEKDMMKGKECNNCEHPVFTRENNDEGVVAMYKKLNNNQKFAIKKLMKELLKGEKFVDGDWNIKENRRAEK